MGFFFSCFLAVPTSRSYLLGQKEGWLQGFSSDPSCVLPGMLPRHRTIKNRKVHKVPFLKSRDERDPETVGGNDRCISEENYARLLLREERGSNEANRDEKFISKLVLFHFPVYFKYG